MAKNKKLLTSGIAVVAAAGVLFGGTFAWQSISQTALNEVSKSVNPGGRLHDDFNDISDTTDLTVELNGKEVTPMTFDKDVYVENFTEYAQNGVQVFARVRLDEYMELGQGAGELNEEETAPAAGNKATPLVAGTKLEDKGTWSTIKYGEDSAYRAYWDLTFGGQTIYMPTFNKNKDSLEADINGTSADNFASHVDYTLESEKTANAIYDVDAEPGEENEEVDEIVEAGLTAKEIIEANADDLTALVAQVNTSDETHISVEEGEIHKAQETLNAKVYTMKQYIEDGDMGKTGNFWVYDTDGWAYWANPIDPETATGLLLSQFNRTGAILNQDWYYAINVTAQFVTGDDLGQLDNSGFYDTSEGSAPTANALQLLNNIGVDVTFEVADADALATALANGGTVKLTGDIEITDVLTVNKDTVLDLNGKKITNNTGDHEQSSGVWSMISVRDGVSLIINDETETGSVDAGDSTLFAVDVRDGSKVVINGGKFVGNEVAVYVLKGEAVINGGEFSICNTSTYGEEYNYVLNCYNENRENGTAKITVCGGSFEHFDPASATAGDDGSFVPSGYQSVETDGVWTVSKTSVASAGTEG